VPTLIIKELRTKVCNSFFFVPEAFLF